MLDKESIAILGYSGHAYVVIEAAALMGIDFLGYCEKNSTEQNPYELKYLGFEGDEHFDWGAVDKFALGIGENILRHKIGALISSKNKELLNIVHPNSIISNTAKINRGNFIAANVIVNAQVSIGDYCILNSGCIVEHECKIKNGVHLGPGSVLAGNVEVGQCSFIGANSVVKEGIRIGKNVIVGAGSTVIRDIPDNQTWVGNPAKFINK